ncbi:histidine phosphatase family protein [Chloroflexota bacterium]
MTLKLILVRHGETDWNRILRIQGAKSDSPLNQKGMQQAEDLASRLERENIRAVYSSPLKRALNTAKAIATRHRLEVITTPLLREIEAGELEGVATAELGTRFSYYLIRDGVEKRIPGGESLTDLQERCWGFIEQIKQDYTSGSVLLVSHYFAILSVICAVLELPLANIMRLRMSNASISIIVSDDDMTRLELFNDTSCITP